MTPGTVTALLLVAAGAFACGWLWQRAAASQRLDPLPIVMGAPLTADEPVVADEERAVEAPDDGALLLDTLDLADQPAVIWCPETHRARVNETTRALLQAFGGICEATDEGISARHVSSGDQVTAADLDALVAGESGRMSVWLGGGDETRVALEITARPIRDGASEILLVGHDVTAEHAAIKTRCDLVAALSHDMRSALTSTIGYVALVTDDPTLPREHRDRLEVALKGVNQTLHLMADLRAARQPGREAVRLSINPVASDVATILDEALTSLRPAAEARRISVSVEAPVSVPVVGDPVRLRQVLDNVMLNAVKHNQADGWVDIVLTAGDGAAGDGAAGDGAAGDGAAADGTVTVIVTNSGSTLAPEEQERVFDRYYRSEASRRSGTRGMGLGLNVVKEIVEQHGGTVRIASAPDLDTTTLTMTIASKPAIPAVPTQAAGLSEEVHDDERRSASPRPSAKAG